jgi:hypothetical protein
MTRHIFTTAFLLSLSTVALADPSEYGPPPGHEGPPPAAEVAELMEKVKERYPEKWEYLQDLREENPRKFHDSLGKLRHHMMRASEDPEVQARMKANRELQARFRKAVMEYQEAAEGAQDKHREELLKLASEMFDARQAIRARRLAKAKNRIEDLEDEIAQREKKRTELIETFVDDATGDTLQGL